MSRSINLMPARLLRRFENQRLAAKWVPIWLTVTLLLALGQAALQHSLNQAALNKHKLALRAEPLRGVQTEVLETYHQSAQLEKKLDKQRQLEQADIPLTLLQVVTQSCQACGDGLALDNFEMTETTARAAPATGASRVPTFQKRLTLQGVAESDEIVSRLVQHLRTERVFERVHLEATQATGAQGATTRNFRVLCER